MPYISTPPAVCRDSNMVTSCPKRASSAAAVSPAGPAPTTAAFLPLFGLRLLGKLTSAECSRSQSATKRSRRPIAMEASFLFSMQACSHWVSWGHTLPQTPGKLLVFLSIRAASGISPSRKAKINSGISIFTGQPSTQ